MLSPQADRLTRQVSKMAVARDLAESLKGTNDPVFVASYQWAALLRFHGVDAHQIDGVSRPSHFTQTPERMLDHPAVLYLSNGPLEEKEDDRKVKGTFAGHTAGFERRLIAEFLNLPLEKVQPESDLVHDLGID